MRLFFLFSLALAFASCSTSLTISKQHQQNFEKSFTIENPEVYELMMVASALTDVFQSDSNLVQMTTPYYEEMIEHFEPYKEHKLVRKLNRKFTKDQNGYGMNQFAIRFLALNYELNEKDKLRNIDRYDIPALLHVATAIKPVFNISKNKRLIRDFAKETNFRAFYEEHKAYYEQLISTSHKLNNYTSMWEWMEQQYPDTKYDSYRILISPLTGGYHNTLHIKTKGGKLRQSLMFVSAPTSYDAEKYQEPLKYEVNAGNTARVVFTEIDHNYVNPLSSKHYEKLNKALPDYTLWNHQKEKNVYKSSYKTFNEYMTWAVFTLYAYDTYSAEAFEKINKIQAEFMVEHRKFVHFKAFNEELLGLYKSKEEGETVADLQLKMIDWVAQYHQELLEKTI